MDRGGRRRRLSIPSSHRYLFVISSLAVLDGGPGNAVLNLARSVAQFGERADVLAVGLAGESYPDSLGLAKEAGVRVRVAKIRKRTRWRFGLAFSVFAVLRVIGASRVSLHGFYQFPTLWVGLLCRAFRIPYVIQPHGVLEPYQQLRSSSVKRAYMAIGGRFVLRGAISINVASEQERSNVLAQFPKLSVKIIGMGVEPLSAVPAKAPHHGIERLRVIYLGRLASKKRLDVLLRAVATLPAGTWRLRIVGSGARSDQDALHDLADQLGISRHIDWLGSLVGNEKWQELASSDVLVLPSDNENFGQVVTEAMSVGIPVITTDQVGASEHVLAADAGIVVPPSTPGELRSALLSLQSDRSVRLRLGANGRAYITNTLTWRNVAARFLDSWQV